MNGLIRQLSHQERPLNNRVAIVVPLYRSFLSKYERFSILNCANKLRGFPVIKVSPKYLKLIDQEIEELFTDRLFCDEHHFSSFDTYNRMLLSPWFYRMFLKYDYILIHQTDAFVIDNQLAMWCNKGFDYVGAPWLTGRECNRFTRRIERIVGQLLQKKNISILPRVGNGGFSLRRVEAIIKLLQKYRIESFLWNRNEDIFFSVYGSIANWFKMPLFDDALSFCFEQAPRKCFELTGGRLPFGCHGWEKNDKRFWESVIPEMASLDNSMGDNV